MEVHIIKSEMQKKKGKEKNRNCFIGSFVSLRLFNTVLVDGNKVAFNTVCLQGLFH